MNILFAGGGSGGPVAPLLAVADEIKKKVPDAKFLLIGGTGPEAAMAERQGMAFLPIHAGKFRRYVTLKNLLAPFLMLAGFFEALRILGRFGPDCVMGAGSYIQVPVAWAARLRGIPVLLHQQDVVPSLSNTLCAPAASKITVTFGSSLKDFPQTLGFSLRTFPDKVVHTGNPFREELRGPSRQEGLGRLGIPGDLPVILIFGGGTGAAGINAIVAQALPQLVLGTRVVHATGQDRKKIQFSHPNYFQYDFIHDMAAAYAAADLVICRAGLSTITELSNLEKISIIIPMPDSHQELNAHFLQQSGSAMVASQKGMNGEMLIRLIKKILYDGALQRQFQKNISALMPRHSAGKIADMVIALASSHAHE